MKKTTFSIVLLFLFNVINAQDSFLPDTTIEINKTKSISELKDIYNVGTTDVNTKQSEIGSTFFMNKYIMYSSRRTGAIGAGKDSETNLPYNSLYCMSIDKNGNLSKPYFFASVLDSKGNEGGLTFSPNEKIVYYTKSDEKNQKNFQLYKRIFDEECRCTWIQESAVNFNSSDYSIENPRVSPDGKKLYFASNMPGGFGGFDLYVADIDENNMPVNPKNLGNTINTSGDEKFPYVSNEKELYFSSTGHEGYGNFDVFVSRIKKNSYSSPLNLGKTINSNANDIAFILASKNKGYITSDKATGLGSYDIYMFDLQKNIIKIEGKTIEEKSKIALPNTTITLVDDEGQEISSQKSSPEGNYSFEVTPIENYSIVTKKEGYLDSSKPFSTDNNNSILTIEMQQKKAEVTETAIVIENIYFEYNKATLKLESTLSLNKIVEVLASNPDMKIAVNAHTDTRGGDKYNMILSEKRANEAKKYLIKKGINSSRLIAKGFGKTQPLSNCGNNCSEIEFDADRRIEFVILK